MDSTSASGRYRYSDITLAVHAPEPAAPPQPAREAAPESGVCDWTDARARVRASTVKVVTPTASGTAFYVGGNQWITAAHVVNDRPARITLSNSRIRASATLLALNANSDLAILIADASGANPIGWAGTLPQDTQIAVVGYPLGQSTSSITRGFVTRHDSRGGVSYIQTDASVNPGNSGGPLVDACGRVGGVVSSRAEETRDGRPIDGIAFAVAEPTLRASLTALGLTGYSITPRGQYPDDFDAPANQQPDNTPAGCAHPDPYTTYFDEDCINGVLHALVGGQVYVNGEHAPDGELLEAVVNGTVCGSTTTARFSIRIPEGCGGATHGTPITLRYGGVTAITLTGLPGNEREYTPTWSVRARNCDPNRYGGNCTQSPGGYSVTLRFSTPATPEMVSAYINCAATHSYHTLIADDDGRWTTRNRNAVAARRMAYGLSGDSPWACSDDNSRPRLMAHTDLADWNDALAAHWSARTARWQALAARDYASAVYYAQQRDAHGATYCAHALTPDWHCD